MTRFVVAVNDQYRDRNGQDQESVHFVEVNVWRELAESCAELAKGDPVMVMGRLVTDNWTDKDGNRNYKDKLEGMRVEYLTRGPGGGGTGTRPSANANRDAQRGQETSRKGANNSALDIDEEVSTRRGFTFLNGTR